MGKRVDERRGDVSSGRRWASSELVSRRRSVETWRSETTRSVPRIADRTFAVYGVGLPCLACIAAAYLEIARSRADVLSSPVATRRSSDAAYFCTARSTTVALSLGEPGITEGRRICRGLWQS